MSGRLARGNGAADRPPGARPAGAARDDQAIGADRIDAIERLYALHRAGALTADEYAREKARILGEPAPAADSRAIARDGHAAPADRLRPRRARWLLPLLLGLAIAAAAGALLGWGAQPDEKAPPRHARTHSAAMSGSPAEPSG